MWFYVGKVLQAVALSLVALGLFIGLREEHGLGTELQLALVGIGVFWAGRWVEGLAGR